MPEEADPLDVRYNVIQWVHRSTRGWSYGYPVMDPRTGEIIKGHVSLGSLRVRQDYLIAEGLLAPYDDETVSNVMMEMSLARIRQLSAHEVGHTIGIEHNFAASTQDRASVMDYPVPLIAFDDAGGIDLSNAYDDKIGAWDKRVVTYAYQDFPDGVDAVAGRAAILEETIKNYRFVADEDSRSVGSAHPYGNLWDNGADAVAELTHLLRVRDYALANFSEKNIRIGRPLATLEEALVPMYLLHRFQIQAVSKLIAGDYFNYAMRGDGQDIQRTVSADEQRVAISALLGLLDAEQLQLPQHIIDLIPPRPIGFAKTRETFPNATGTTFDSIGPAESAVVLTLDALLNPQRAARLIEQNANDVGLPGFSDVCASILDATWFDSRDSGTAGLIQRRTDTLVLHALMRLSVDKTASPEVRGIATSTIAGIDNWLSVRTVREGDANWRGLYIDSRSQIAYFRENPAMVAELPQVVVPPGSPIGSDSLH